MVNVRVCVLTLFEVDVNGTDYACVLWHKEFVFWSTLTDRGTEDY